MVTLAIRNDFAAVQRLLDAGAQGARRAVREALNRTAEWAETDARRELRKVFDRPTPYTLRSLRVYYASTANLEARLWFKQRSRDEDDRWATAQIAGGQRAVKPFEQRLQRAGLMPRGWLAVPGEGMPRDAYGNINRGELSRILNVLGTFQEAGFNKADFRTRERLRKGTKTAYGFAYWVNPVGSKNIHIPPGVYRRVYTGFGTSLKPMIVFVSEARYKPRLPFASIVRAAMAKHFEPEFAKAWADVQAGRSPSAGRRARRVQ